MLRAGHAGPGDSDSCVRRAVRAARDHVLAIRNQLCLLYARVARPAADSRGGRKRRSAAMTDLPLVQLQRLLHSAHSLLRLLGRGGEGVVLDDVRRRGRFMAARRRGNSACSLPAW